MPGSYSVHAEDLALSATPGLEVSGRGLQAKITTGVSRTGNGLGVDQAFSPTWTGTHGFSGIAPTCNVDPSAGNDLARRSWVITQIDVAKFDFDIKQSMRAATTAALPAFTFSGNVLTASANGAFPAQDVVTLVLNDRLLVKNESGANEKYNGPYSLTQVGDGTTPWKLTRTTDADSASEVTSGLYTFIEEGTVNGNSKWVLTTDNPITLNTTALVFARYDAQVISAGAGLLRSGDTIDVVATDASVLVNANDLRVQFDGNGGLELNGGVGCRIKLDATASGQLSLGANGARVASGNAGMAVKHITEDRLASAFTFSSPTSTSNTTVTGLLTGANIVQGLRLMKNGLDNMTRVVGQPAASGEWRIDGASKIEINGDITASGDTYRIRYVQAV